MALARAAGGVTVRNLTISGGDFGVGIDGAAAPSLLDAVVIEDARLVGVAVGNAHLRVTDSLVRGPEIPEVTFGIETGTSPDFDDGPILGDFVCPIDMNGDLFHDGERFDPDFDVPQAGTQELGLPFDGFSHMLAYGFSNADAGPAGPLEGSWEFVVTFIDATGSGWRITSRFDVR